MLVPRARGPAAAAARPDETEYRVIVGERTNPGSPAAARPASDRAGLHETPSASANTGEIAPLNQAPDG